MWVAELDLLLEPGIRLNSSTPGYATFVEDPTLERVKRPAGAGMVPSPPAPASSRPQGSPEKDRSICHAFGAAFVSTDIRHLTAGDLDLWWAALRAHGARLAPYASRARAAFT